MTTEQANQLKSIYERVDKLSPTVTKIVIPYSHKAIIYKGQAGDSGVCTENGNITIILHGAEVISATVDGGTADGTGTGGWGTSQTSYGVVAATVSASNIQITTE